METAISLSDILDAGGTLTFAIAVYFEIRSLRTRLDILIAEMPRGRGRGSRNTGRFPAAPSNKE